MSELITMPKYEAYKDSGVEWLGMVPEHWGGAIAKHILRKLARPRKHNGNTVICSNHGYSKLLGDVKQGLVSLTQHDYQGVNEDDLLVHGMDAWHGAISISKHTGDCTSVVHVCDSKHNKIYIAYYLKMLAIRNVYKVISNGVRQNTSDFRSWNKFGDIQIILPPKEEQIVISNFLDKKTTQIDEAIAIKKKQIELLKEHNKIIIQQVVTRGLNPNAPMKDSGVDWIGTIPEEWKVESFKNILVERNKKNDPIKSRERLSLSIDKGITLYSEKTTNLDRFKDDFSQYKLTHSGDLVFNSMNMIVGAVGVSNYFGCVSPVYYTYYSRLDNPKITKYYEYFFKNRIVQSQLFCLGKGIMAIDRGEGKFNTVRLKVSRHGLRSMKVPYPTISEIIEIVDFLELESSKINKAIRLQKQQIEKLKEYKTTLINSVVTGEIRVSEVI
jgi:type I restriction enzyme S subunit